MQPSSWQQIRKRSRDEDRYKLLSIEEANINEKTCKHTLLLPRKMDDKCSED